MNSDQKKKRDVAVDTDLSNDQHPIASHVEEILDDQRERISSGKPIDIEIYFQKHPELSAQPELAVDVIYNDFVLRKSFGIPAEPEDYLRRFSNFAEALENQFQLFNVLDLAADATIHDEPTEHASKESYLAAVTSPSRFDLKEKLGEGGFANVYRAWDEQLKRFVAIKVSKNPIKPGTRQYKRFEREANSAARLSHSSIVGVHEFGNQDGHPFIVCQIMEGGSLADKLMRADNKTEQVVSWLISICDALDYAHSCGVIHRDIKPGNILFDDNDNPMLADFGLASLVESDQTLTRQGELLGTPAYMSPEQARGEMAVGTRSDVYSLGVVMYQLICCRLPFHGLSASILQQTIADDPPQPRSIDSKIQFDLQTICLKAMAKDVNDRYSTARAMGEDLRRFSKGEPILARPVSTAEKISKLIRRYPMTSAIAAAAILFAGVAFGGSLQYVNVVKQKNRATIAESETRRLLGIQAANSGQLAMRQGQTKLAVQHFEEALNRKAEDSDSIHLMLAKCKIINGDVDGAVLSTTKIKDQSLKQDANLVKCQLALLGANQFGDPIEIMDSIDSAKLSTADQLYLAGLNAETSFQAWKHFDAALLEDNFHHGARRMANIMGLSLAKISYVAELCHSSRQQFPDDDEFLLVEALAFAAQGKTKDALTNIKTTNLKHSECEAWLDFVNFICEICDETQLEGEGEFLFSDMLETIQQFEDQFAPLIRSRQWFLPPRIALKLNNFFSNSVNEIRHADFDMDLLTETAMTHPEATLNCVIASELLDKAPWNVQSLVAIQKIFENALSADGFVPDVSHEALEGAFAIAIHLVQVKKYNVESNTNRTLKLLKLIDPKMIDDVEHLRIMTLFPLIHNEFDLAGRFAPRWVEVAKNSLNQTYIRDSLWHQGIIYKRQEEWYEVLLVCDELLERFPDDKSGGHYQPLDLRENAVGKLATTMGVARTGFTWNAAFESAIYHENWELAESAISQLKQQEILNPNEQHVLKIYEQLFASAREGRWIEFKSIVEQVPPTQLTSVGRRLSAKAIGKIEEQTGGK